MNVKHAGGRSRIKILILGRRSGIVVAFPLAGHYGRYTDSKETRQIHKINTYQGLPTTKTPHV